MSELEVTETSTEEVTDTIDPLKELQDELDKVKDQFLRAKAETENIRKRSSDDLVKARKFAVENFAHNLIAVADSLYSAIGHAHCSEDKKGFEMTLDQLMSAFTRENVIEINPAIGNNFDPHLHQAVSAIESEQPANTVVEVLQKGYTISGKVLRPAMVAVSKQKEEKDNGKNEPRGSDENQDGQDQTGPTEFISIEGSVG